MMPQSQEEMEKAICDILLELCDDPRFSYEDCAKAIIEKVIIPYRTFLFTQFVISSNAYERRHC